MNDNFNMTDKEKSTDARAGHKTGDVFIPENEVKIPVKAREEDFKGSNTRLQDGVKNVTQRTINEEPPAQVQPSRSAMPKGQVRPKQTSSHTMAKEQSENRIKKTWTKEIGVLKKNTAWGEKKLGKVKAFLSSGIPHDEWTRSERTKKKITMSAFAAASLIFILLAFNLGYSYGGESIRVVSETNEATRSAAKAYRIVYSESDPFGLFAAKALHDAFLEKTGASLEIKSDAEAVSLHEIRVGYTNRATDDYLTSVSTLGTDGYAVLVTSSDSVNIISFSEAGANAAIKYFISNYVGAYRGSSLTFASKNNFSLVSRDGNEPDVSLRETKVLLNFTESGKFRIIVFSDADLNPNTIKAIEAIVDSEKPQLVVFAGDVSSENSTKAELEEYIKTLSAPLEGRKIPWAVTFGEQDTSAGLPAESQADVYMAFPYCVMKKDCTADGAVSYFLPIYPHGEIDASSRPVLGAFVMGQNSMLSALSNGTSGDAIFEERRKAGTDYGYVTANHIAWFAMTSKILEREGGGELPAVMITHTPTEEFSLCVKEAEKTRLFGNVGEEVASSPLNSGLFASLLDCGNVLGLYCGHDHLNTFSAKYCGIELAYSGSIGYDGYGLGGTFRINNSLRGGRLIEFTMRDGRLQTSSRMVYASDFEIGEG